MNSDLIIEGTNIDLLAEACFDRFWLSEFVLVSAAVATSRAGCRSLG